MIGLRILVHKRMDMIREKTKRKSTMKIRVVSDGDGGIAGTVLLV